MKEYFEEKYEVTIRREVKSGLVSDEIWRDKHGNMSRPNGPHRINYDLDTGNWEMAVFDYHPDKPSSVKYDPTTQNPIRIDYFSPNGQLHRDPSQGGAIVHLDPETGETLKEYYFLNGVPVSKNGDRIEYEDPFQPSP